MSPNEIYISYFYLLEVDFECTKHIDTDEEMGDEKVA